MTIITCCYWTRTLNEIMMFALWFLIYFWSIGSTSHCGTWHSLDHQLNAATLVSLFQSIDTMRHVYVIVVSNQLRKRYPWSEVQGVTRAVRTNSITKRGVESQSSRRSCDFSSIRDKNKMKAGREIFYCSPMVICIEIMFFLPDLLINIIQRYQILSILPYGGFGRLLADYLMMINLF